MGRNEHLSKVVFGVVAVVLCMNGSVAFSQDLEFGFSPNPTGSGAQAMGMGNAFTAAAWGETAASWNPAGLMNLDDRSFSFSLNYLDLDTDLDGGAAHPESDSSDGVSLTRLNHLSLLFPYGETDDPRQGKNRFALGVNYLRQFRLDTERSFDYQSVQGAAALDWSAENEQDGELSSVTLSGGYSFDLFYVGLGLNVWNDSVTDSSSFQTETRTQGTTTITPPGPPAGVTSVDFVEKNTYTVDNGYSATLGAMFMPPNIPNFRLSMVYEPQFDLDIDHDQTTFNAVTGNRTSRSENADLTMPGKVTLGALYRIPELTSLEEITGSDRVDTRLTCDVVWTDWSKFVMEEDNAAGVEQRTVPTTGRSTSEGKLQDTYSARVGAEFRFYPQAEREYFIPVRIGGGYDPSPRVGGRDDAYLLSCGVGIHKNGWLCDIAYQHRWANDAYAFETVESGVTNVFEKDTAQHRVMLTLGKKF